MPFSNVLRLAATFIAVAACAAPRSPGTGRHFRAPTVSRRITPGR